MERYFKPVNKTANADDLPVDPAGPLSLSISPAAIKQVNQEVQVARDASKRGRGSYLKVSLDVKMKIAKFAVENGIGTAVRKFEGTIPNLPKNWKNTVRDWKNSYVSEMERKRKAGETDGVLLPDNKRGRPLLIGADLDNQSCG